MGALVKVPHKITQCTNLGWVMTDTKKPAYQESKDKVKGLPFSSVKEMKNAENEIALDIWKRLTKFKNFNAQLERDDFKEVKEEFSRGVICAYSTHEDDNDLNGDTGILRVYKAKRGIQVKINEQKATDPDFLSKLASDMTYSFSKLFYQLGGLQESEAPSNQMDPSS